MHGEISFVHMHTCIHANTFVCIYISVCVCVQIYTYTEVPKYGLMCLPYTINLHNLVL